MSKPVNFNAALANDAITALQKLQSNLHKFQQSETAPRNKALRGWTGPYGDRFRTSTTQGAPWITGQAALLQTQIAATITCIQDGITDAQAAKAKQK
ncbi:MAG: hypothetical protein ACREQM_07490 [Candidatus Dormibacteraceae bacterium]